MNSLIYVPAVLRALPLLAASRDSEDPFPHVIRWIDLDVQVRVRVLDAARVRTLVRLELDDVNLQNFRVRVIGRDQVIKGDAVIIEFSKRIRRGCQSLTYLSYSRHL